MAYQAQTFRIFVSSTFSDLKAERSALQANVFPRLRELCEKHNTHFQPIDLRWGVSSEASLDQQAMNICLGEVARCQKVSPRPNFIILLGDRYGWMPPPSQILEDDFQAIRAVVADQGQTLLENWYTLDKNAVPAERRLKPRKKGGPFERYEDWQLVEAELQQILSEAVDRLGWPAEKRLPYQNSATHQEIVHGALQQTDAPEHVFCFFRSIPGLPKTFSAAEFQSMLKTRLALEYPRGLSPDCSALVDLVLNLPSEATAEVVRTQIDSELEDAPDASPVQDVLRFMRHVLADLTAKDYVNLDEVHWTIDDSAYNKLQSLKDDLRSKFRANLYEAPDVSWLANQPPVEGKPYQLISKGHIGRLPADLADCMPILADDFAPENLCEALFRSLGRLILAEIEDPRPPIEKEERIIYIQPDAELDAEGLAHHTFAEERLAYFVGREEILCEIKDYIKSRDRQMLVIGGEGGTGKSALLAKAVESAQRSQPDAQLVYRFIGATPGSSDGRSLLEGLCKEISRRYGGDESDVPTDFRDLVPEFTKQMSLATVEKPLILFLDSLDQLLSFQDARRLTWLPAELPAHVKLVVSSRKEKDIYPHLEQKNVIEKQLGGLDETYGMDLLYQWLDGIGRDLTDEQQQEVLSKFTDSKGNPLYLRLAFEEARLWPSGDGHPPKPLESGIEGIIQENMIPRLAEEGNHGKTFLSHALGYLATSRNGLAEDELVDLLSRDIEVYEAFFRQTYHLPSDLMNLAVDYLKEHPLVLENIPTESHHDAEREALAWLKQDRNPPEPVMVFLREALCKPDGPRLPIVLWSRLSFDLAPYLSERLVDGSALLVFYHRELGDVSKAAFLAGDQDRAYHGKLADYFRFKADPAGDNSWTGGDIHGLSELPYHLAGAGLEADLRQILLDPSFLQARLEASETQALIDDYELIHTPGLPIPAESRRSLELVQGALRLSAQALADDIRQLPGQLTGRLLVFEQPDIQLFLKQLEASIPYAWLRPRSGTLVRPDTRVIHSWKLFSKAPVARMIVSDDECTVAVVESTGPRFWDIRTGIEANRFEVESAFGNVDWALWRANLPTAHFVDQDYHKFTWSVESPPGDVVVRCHVQRHGTGHYGGQYNVSYDNSVSIRRTAQPPAPLERAAEPKALKEPPVQKRHHPSRCPSNNAQSWRSALRGEQGPMAEDRAGEVDLGKYKFCSECDPTAPLGVSVPVETQRAELREPARRESKTALPIHMPFYPERTNYLSSGLIAPAISRDGRLIVCGGLHGAVQAWDSASRTVRFADTIGPGTIVAVAPFRSLERVAILTIEGRLLIADISGGASTDGPEVLAGRPAEVYVSPSGRRAVLCESNAPMSVWDTITGRPLHTCGLGAGVVALKERISSDLAISISTAHGEDKYDGWLLVGFDLDTGKALFKFESHITSDRFGEPVLLEQVLDKPGHAQPRHRYVRVPTWPRIFNERGKPMTGKTVWIDASSGQVLGAEPPGKLAVVPLAEARLSAEDGTRLEIHKGGREVSVSIPALAEDATAGGPSTLRFLPDSKVHAGGISRDGSCVVIACESAVHCLSVVRRLR